MALAEEMASPCPPVRAMFVCFLIAGRRPLPASAGGTIRAAEEMASQTTIRAEEMMALAEEMASRPSPRP